MDLPDWLGELPRLQTVDAGRCLVLRTPSLPWVRWVVDADTLLVQRQIDPGKVDGVSISAGTSADALHNVLRLIYDGRLAITKLTVDVRSAAGTEHLELVEKIIGESSALRRLDVSRHPLGRVPESIRGLRQLTDLSLTDLGLGSVPPWLFELPMLTRLDLRNNRLVELPSEIAHAVNLIHLRLAGNLFQQIPDGIWQLTALTLLDLRGCPISAIPVDILRMLALTTLQVDAGRPELAVPPPEVAARGLEAIKSYWSQERASGVDYLAEAKLLIVGEAGAGKTTLAKKILDPDYPLDPQENSTTGIAVDTWQFPSAIRNGAAVGAAILHRDFRVNVWDFGGQEIYHSTHQFFLTKRSVYVLLTDGRREDADFGYWLEMIKLLSDGSPLIVVENRRRGRTQGLDLRRLRQDYPNLVATLTIDLADNSGLTELTALIRRELELLPHIGTALPRSWQGVRETLDEDDRDYILADEFFRICAGHGFLLEDDMRQLGGFLHDLGICLFFQADPLLGRVVVLKPAWGTHAVYRVLDDPGIKAARGEFGLGDLERIWHEPTYARMRAELVRLMAKFSLCYQVRGGESFVAPQLLSPNPPDDFRWDEPGDLTLRYEYDVMPKGVVRRLIVELNDLIEEDRVWRDGAVFAYGPGRAEVVENYRTRQLQIRLSPRDPRVMLSAIDRALTIIHRSYPDLRFRRLRPCSCEVCARAGEPAMFSVDELEDFARAGDQIQCRRSHLLLDAATLLSELWQPLGVTSSAPISTAPEIFVSYKWGGAADALVDQIVAELQSRGLVITRDRSTVRYRDSIQRFMRRLGQGSAIVVVLDDAYLKSKNCMFELTEIAGRPDFAKSIYPIVLGDAKIFDALDRIEYVSHWEAKRAALESKMRTVGLENLSGIREDLDLYSKIRAMIAKIVDLLSDMNTLTEDEHRGSDFSQLYDALDQRPGTTGS